MDISESLAPTSDQLDAIELVAGPRTFIIESVSAGSAEQPVQVHLEGFPRAWRPAKSMRRVLAAGWGTDASAWAGKRVTLFFEPDVSFGKDRVGGTRIKAMSHLDKRLSVPLLISRGKSAIFTVEPLPDAPTEPTAEQVAASTDIDELRAMYAISGEERREQITARVNEIRTT